MIRKLAIFFAIASCAFAQTSAKTARDQATLDQYVRQVFGPTVELKLSLLKPSASLPGFFQANIHGTGGSFEQVRPILSKFLVKNLVLKGDSYSVELKLSAPQSVEAMRIPHDGFSFDVPVYVSADGQRILIGEVFDLNPKAPAVKPK